MRYPHPMFGPRFFRFAVAVVLAAGILAGCGRDQSPPTGPTSPSVAASFPRSHRIAGPDAPDVALTIEVQKRSWPELRGTRGVVGSAVSLDEGGTPVILILVDRAGRGGVPASLEGISTRTEVVGTPVPFAPPPPPPPPVQMGSSTANDYNILREVNCTVSGTLGCTVLSGRTAYFLSCNHVFANANYAELGDPIVSPSRADNHDGNPCGPSQVVATLYDFEPINYSGVNLFDAAIAKVSKKVNYTCAMRSGYTPTSTPAAAEIGMAVKKTGRTTYLTQGTVTAINGAISVSYAGGGAYFEGQILIDGTIGGFSLQGDSGSLVVSDPANDPVGLVFAGDPSDGNPTYANPIQPVLDRFNVTVCSD